ncbi:MAG: hypothetical protein MR413_07495, partial [Clostridia bacterium]|nr:hypothetical protein [Clostridia bacterium]
MKRRNDSEAVNIDKEKLKLIAKDSRVITGVILFIFVTVMFAVSVSMRSEYKDYISLDHHHHLTATSVAFTNNWLDDGIFHDHFAMMANPDSVEFPTLKDRSFYDSYPPGCIVPLYILAKLSGTNEITFGFVQRWNLFNQYAVTLLLAFIVYLLFIKIKSKPYTGFIAAVIPTAINLFMPAPFYFFHSVYFADQAVLLPFILTIFLEMLWTWSEKEKTRKILAICEGVVIFAGMITDYLFVCLVVILYIKRLVLKEISFKSFFAWLKDSLKFAAPAILAVALFVLQIAVNGPVRIIDMFLFRTGMSDTSGWTSQFERIFWKDYIAKGYGANMYLVLKGSLLIVLVMILAYFILNRVKGCQNKKIVWILSTAAMVMLPCFMQVYLLKNHSAIHDFSTLKFSLVLSVVPFVLIPAAVIEFVKQLRNEGKNTTRYSVALNIVMVVIAVASCAGVYSTHTKNAESFFPKVSKEVVTVGNFLQANTGYNDVVFSDNYQIEDTNGYPARVALAKKRVYKIDSISQIYDKVKNINEDYTINIFSYGGENHSEKLKKLIDIADDVIREDNIVLYKIDKDEFLKL